jgi:hypothetical protein
MIDIRQFIEIVRLGLHATVRDDIANITGPLQHLR